ncbi:exodeoxyribonuclease VII large subunit [bacterium]|nr:exodeoxyribonuclease VII large subunit [bacterium]
MQQRPLFGQSSGSSASETASPVRVYSVSELNAEMKLFVEATYPMVWVEGEVSNFTQPSSGHFYFNLKDSKSLLKAVMWKSSHRFLKWQPKNGMKVMVHGRLTVYEPQGCYQIDIVQIVPHGKGDLYAAFEQLKEKLKTEGLFESSRKRPIPMFPKKIGIITSRTGAAIRDILNILNRRFANLHILIFPATVQGEEAAPSIIEGLRALNLSKTIEVIILARGGGSIEDLWPFNEELVARAIAASRIPVISAVGHETDTTISDFVADLRAPTPSAAAELVIGKKSEFAESLQNLSKRMNACLQSRLLYLRNRANVASQHRALAGFPQKIRTQQQMVDDFEGRLRSGLTRYHQIQARRFLSCQQKMSPAQLMHLIQLKRSRLIELFNKMQNGVQRRIHTVHRAIERYDGKLDSLSPLAVLERGYSISSTPEGAILKDAVQTAPGKEIRIRLHRGRLKCEVKEIDHD